MELSFELYDDVRHTALVEPLTELLHEAYAGLAEQGMRFMASHQPPAITRQRLQERGGEGWLFWRGGELVGTVSLYPGHAKRDPTEYYQRPGVWVFSQFAIRRDLQGAGLGSQAMDFVEARARARGATELALDTSERATGLLALYGKRGFRVVSSHQWPDTNYRSLILSKTLPSGA